MIGTKLTIATAVVAPSLLVGIIGAMSGAEITSIITAVTALVAAVGTIINIFVSRSNSRNIREAKADIKEAKVEIGATKVVVEDVKKATDGMKTELVEATKQVGIANVAVARGAGRDEQRERHELDDLRKKSQHIELPAEGRAAAPKKEHPSPVKPEPIEMVMVNPPGEPLPKVEAVITPPAKAPK